MKILVLREALANIESAKSYYNQKVSGLGEELALEVEKGFDNILSLPYAWKPLDSIYRKYLIRRFSYAIVYRVDNEVIRITKVKHDSQESDY